MLSFVILAWIEVLLGVEVRLGDCRGFSGPVSQGLLKQTLAANGPLPVIFCLFRPREE